MKWYLIAELAKGLKIYGVSKDKEICEREMISRTARTPDHSCPLFRVVNEITLKQMKDLEQKRKHEKATANRKRGAQKARDKAEYRKSRGLPPKKFITCPTCDAKSKLLRSEMGGLQTRKCKNGHNFEVDTFFGGEMHKRRVERTDRPIFVEGNYVDYILGKFKNDPEGKNER